MIACSKTPDSAGPAADQMTTTSPAVIRVINTQPGTSPRSAQCEGVDAVVKSQPGCVMSLTLIVGKQALRKLSTDGLGASSRTLNSHANRRKSWQTNHRGARANQSRTFSPRTVSKTQPARNSSSTMIEGRWEGLTATPARPCPRDRAQEPKVNTMF